MKAAITQPQGQSVEWGQQDSLAEMERIFRGEIACEEDPNRTAEFDIYFERYKTESITRFMGYREELLRTKQPGSLREIWGNQKAARDAAEKYTEACIQDLKESFFKDQMSELVKVVFAPSISADQKEAACAAINKVLTLEEGQKISIQDMGNIKCFTEKLIKAIDLKYVNCADKLQAFLKDVQKENTLPDDNPLKIYENQAKGRHSKESRFILLAERVRNRFMMQWWRDKDKSEAVENDKVSEILGQPNGTLEGINRTVEMLYALPEDKKTFLKEFYAGITAIFKSGDEEELITETLRFNASTMTDASKFVKSLNEAQQQAAQAKQGIKGVTFTYEHREIVAKLTNVPRKDLRPEGQLLNPIAKQMEQQYRIQTGEIPMGQQQFLRSFYGKISRLHTACDEGEKINAEFSISIQGKRTLGMEPQHFVKLLNKAQEKFHSCIKFSYDSKVKTVVAKVTDADRATLEPRGDLLKAFVATMQEQQKSTQWVR